VTNNGQMIAVPNHDTLHSHTAPTTPAANTMPTANGRELLSRHNVAKIQSTRQAQSTVAATLTKLATVTLSASHKIGFDVMTRPRFACRQVRGRGTQGMRSAWAVLLCEDGPHTGAVVSLSAPSRRDVGYGGPGLATNATGTGRVMTN